MQGVFVRIIGVPNSHVYMALVPRLSPKTFTLLRHLQLCKPVGKVALPDRIFALAGEIVDTELGAA